jgi:hypothetical protein
MVVTLPADFTEADYLEANPDVAAAVRMGSVPSGEAHYLSHGAREGRIWNIKFRPEPPMVPQADGSRRDKILGGLNLRRMRGVEIGALNRPLVRRTEGQITYVDHTDTESLRTKYREDTSVNVADIVDVDAIWAHTSLKESIGPDLKFDYVVASHVIEHVPNLIAWLEEIEAILNQDGSLRLAIPDRRYSFDILRPETKIHDVLDAYLRKARAPSPRHILEYCSLVRKVDCAAAWSSNIDLKNLEPYHSVKHGISVALDALENGAYHDVHCWVFTPFSFADLCLQMAENDLLHFSCENFFDTPSNLVEFYVNMKLSKDKNEVLTSWRAMRDKLAKG